MLLTQAACLGKDCPAGGTGCRSCATGTLDVPRTRDDLEGTRLEVCRNGTCVHSLVVRRLEDGELLCQPTSTYPGYATCDPPLETTATGVLRLHRWVPASGLAWTAAGCCGRGAGAAPMHAVSVIVDATATAPATSRLARTRESVKTTSPCWS